MKKEKKKDKIFLFHMCHELITAQFPYRNSLEIPPTGAVLENNIYYNESSRMLQYAVDEANEKILPETGMKLGIEIETISYGQEYTVSKRACSLLEVIFLAFFSPRAVSNAKKCSFVSVHRVGSWESAQ